MKYYISAELFVIIVLLTMCLAYPTIIYSFINKNKISWCHERNYEFRINDYHPICVKQINKKNIVQIPDTIK